MLLRYILAILFGYNFVLTVKCQSNDFFERKCSLNYAGRTRRCKIYVDFFKLDFNDFRRWTSDFEDSDKVSLEVSCSLNGRIFLPWPMRAKGLSKLHVKSCIIEGFSSEYNKSTNLKDELEELVLDNCVVESSLDSIFSVTYGRITQEYDCGQQAVHSIVRRNITYSFPKSKHQGLTKRQEQLLMGSADQLISKTKQKTYKCRYDNLEYIDDSISQSRSKLHLRLMMAYSEYPSLQTLLLADNGYRRIPRELIDWRTSFPKLEYLDMSNNKIAKFDFQGRPFNPKTNRQRPFFVNLSHNRVTNIPLNIEDYINDRVPIIVDLTGNPLKCDCSFLRYKRYVLQVLQKYPRFNALSHITCYSTRLRARKRLSEYANSNCLF